MKVIARMSARDRRALGLGALIALPALAWGLAVKPYRSALVDVHARVEQERSLLEREIALLAQAPRMPAEIRKARRASTLAGQRLFTGNDVIEATSALSSYVGHALRTANVVVQQVESRDAGEARNGLREIAIDIRAEGSLDGVLRALRAMESGPRLLRVSRIGIERSMAAPAQGAAESLVVGATVRGYALVDGGGER